MQSQCFESAYKRVHVFLDMLLRDEPRTIENMKNIRRAENKWEHKETKTERDDNMREGHTNNNTLIKNKNVECELGQTRRQHTAHGNIKT